jgi:hypothetical protein
METRRVYFWRLGPYKRAGSLADWLICRRQIGSTNGLNHYRAALDIETVVLDGDFLRQG